MSGGKSICGRDRKPQRIPAVSPLLHTGPGRGANREGSWYFSSCFLTRSILFSPRRQVSLAVTDWSRAELRAQGMLLEAFSPWEKKERKEKRRRRRRRREKWKDNKQEGKNVLTVHHINVPRCFRVTITVSYLFVFCVFTVLNCLRCLSLSLPVCLSLSIPVCLSLCPCLSVPSLSPPPPPSQSLCLFLSVSLSLSVCLSPFFSLC